MPTVSIGVPVYNGIKHISECLECLVNQTFADMEIVVLDNASTDGTDKVIKKFARRDPRVIYKRQPKTVPALQNFSDVLFAATGEYFCWRAYDDLSSSDFIEKLYRKLRDNPGAKLAVGSAVTITDDEPEKLTLAPPQRYPDQPQRDICGLLFNSHPSTLYGLWHRQTLKELHSRVMQAYSDPWASDHLLVYPILIDRAIVFDQNAKFIQRIYASDTRFYGFPDLKNMKKLRKNYFAFCCQILDERDFSFFQRLILKIMTWFQMGKTVAMFRTVLKRTIFRED